MRGNTTFAFTRGATDSRLYFELYDEGLTDQPAVLVYLTVAKRHSPPVIDTVECVVTSASGTGEAFNVKGYFVFGGEIADLPAGEYQMKFKVICSDFSRVFYPTDATRSFGKIVVAEAI